MGIVVNILGDDASGKDASAFWTGESCDGMFFVG